MLHETFPIPDAEFDPTVLPQTAPRAKNATPEQQTRFAEAYNEFWKRLHLNDGKNACADLFGGILTSVFRRCTHRDRIWKAAKAEL